MRDEYDHIQELGAEVVTIGTGNADYARSFVRDHQIPFPVLVDDAAEAATAAAIERQPRLRRYALGAGLRD